MSSSNGVPQIPTVLMTQELGVPTFSLAAESVAPLSTKVSICVPFTSIGFLGFSEGERES